MPKEIIDIPIISELIRATAAPISPVVRAGGFVFISGQPPIDLTTGRLIEGGSEVQAEASLACMKFALETAGSSLDKAVKTTVYVSNAAHFDTVNRVYARYFVDAFPTRTFVAVGSWPLAFDIEIEIECTALA